MISTRDCHMLVHISLCSYSRLLSIEVMQLRHLIQLYGPVYEAAAILSGNK